VDDADGASRVTEKTKLLSGSILEMAVDNASDLAQNLRFFRTSRRLAQRQLADLAGLSRATVSRLERGASDWKPSTISRLAKALKVLPEQLTGAPYQREFLPSAAELKLELIDGIVGLDEARLQRLHPIITEMLALADTGGGEESQ
jgi:transcriptional regulator with XRE-family HTH domain